MVGCVLGSTFKATAKRERKRAVRERLREANIHAVSDDINFQPPQFRPPLLGLEKLVGREENSVDRLRWNITSLSFVNVWEDPWVPSLPGFRLSSSRPPDSPIIYVADLIDASSNQWNRPLLFLNFNSEDCKAILKIPVGGIGREAQRIWHFSKDGRLTVKSAYFILKRLQTTIFYGKHPDPILSVRKAHNDFEEVQHLAFLQQHSLLTPVDSSRSCEFWVPPPTGVVKINCDASFDSKSGRAGISVLVRNSHGLLVDGIAFSMWSLSPLTAEGEVVHQALILAIAKNYNQAYVETDSLQLAQLFSSQSTPVWELDAISQDI
ncbi:uncharacterized protein LOC131177998 [Hevea brasiliensis]|uniref:uncharacterized protein LOC131177998 n=1 Tax=Hevea brasiliensis TaxID=3981 RepID=UPI0025CBFC79|nr:uncharacterized protein LOC131177998 [Hevea brasiliensis]